MQLWGTPLPIAVPGRCSRLPLRLESPLPRPGKLTASGSYRWSRNPQYLGWFLFLLGFALTDWSL